MIRVSLSEFNGYQLANLRNVVSRPTTTCMKPGNAGIAVRLEKLPAVIQALTDLEVEARRLGLVE
jgi:hypothetical protein